MMRLVLALAIFCSALGARGAEPALGKGSVVVLPLDGAVSEAQFFFLRRALKKAEAAGAEAVVLDMDTPGGALQSTEKIVKMIMESPVPVYTYVNANAGSAGALIALGTKKVFMAPVSAIGAAAPVVGGGQEIPATMNAKIVSYFSGYFRSVAAENGYHPQLVDGFMNLDKEVKVGDEVINPKGALLTLSAQEATKVIDGKPLLASGIAKDVKAVTQQVGLDPARLVTLEPSGFEKIAQWITMLAPVFLLAGAVSAYLEFKTPGFGIAGAISAVCFGLFFAGHYVAGLAGLELVAVFALGVALIVVEMVFFPGLLLLALAGSVLMLGSLFVAMVDVYPARPLEISFEGLLQPMANLSIAIVGAVFFIMLLARFLPDLPFFRRIALSTQQALGPQLAAAGGSRLLPDLAVGAVGVAVSALRPAGKARFGDTIVDVLTDGDFVSPGSTVRVVRVAAGRVEVAPEG